MYTKTQPRLFPKLLTAILAGSLLLSACTLVPAATHLPVNTMIPVTGEPYHLPYSPWSVPATEDLAAAIPTAQSPSSTGTTVTFGVANSRRAGRTSQRGERH